MIKWGIALIIGVATMLIGYEVGVARAKTMYQMVNKLLDLVDQRTALAEELMRQAKEIINEFESEGREG